MAEEYKEFLEFKAFQEFKASKAKAVGPVVEPMSFASIVKTAPPPPPPTPLFVEDTESVSSRSTNTADDFPHKAGRFVKYIKTHKLVQNIFTKVCTKGDWLWDMYRLLYTDHPDRFTVTTDPHSTETTPQTHISISIQVRDNWFHRLHLNGDMNGINFTFTHATILEKGTEKTIATYISKPTYSSSGVGGYF
jgi:hypothetical protein